MTTGVGPDVHGIIANGIATFGSAEDQQLIDASSFADYRRQISFWEQSNQLLDARRFWQDSSGPSRYRTALLFMQNSMPGFSSATRPLRPAADIVLTPKPDHGPDGRPVRLCWSEPRELVAELFSLLGPFPLMNYWGPMAGIAASQWIARAAAHVWTAHRPDLQWTYVPHLDYDLQRFGPESPAAAQAVADVAAAVEPLIEAVLGENGKLVVLSEYAMREVRGCIQPNRLLAGAGLLKTCDRADGRLIDYVNSAAVAMVDHQIAHVYCRSSGAVAAARSLLGASGCLVKSPGEAGVKHRRSGDLVLLAPREAWYDYRWWPSDEQAPSFARMVDIHRKPGYDPLELLWDAAIKGISQNPALIRGSHGLCDDTRAVFAADGFGPGEVRAKDVAGIIDRLVTG